MLYESCINSNFKKTGETDTFKTLPYKFQIHHKNAIQPACDLEMIIIEGFCVAAATAIKLQCAWEYDFEGLGELPATAITNLNEEELEGSLNNILWINNQQTCLCW